MTTSDNEAPPTRGAEHERLAAFLGDWHAEGTSYGGTDQTGENPKANGVSWTSRHSGRWHTGGFFLIQDERAILDRKDVFDTVSILGIDATTGACVLHSFENHGFARRYDVTVDGNIWKLSGELERATITFSDDDRTQTLVWEWKPGDEWLPLCDRTAVRVD